MAKAPTAQVGVFVGNAWDPQEGRETPWIDKGVVRLPPAGKRHGGCAPRRGLLVGHRATPSDAFSSFPPVQVG